MKAFMDKEFMLQSPVAQHLYHTYAADMPICDYHCHISPKEIYENRRFENIAQVWLGGRNPDGSYFGDHYKWRAMRSCGVDERYCTGDASPREKFQKFAYTLQYAIGNPLGELTFTMTAGYISALDREITPDRTPINMLQTDVAINAGNSGGPLFDMDGNVIGMTTAKVSGTTESGVSIEGLGFAIPMGSACFVVNDIIAYGEFRGTPSLGITVTTVAVGSGTVSTP